MEKKIKGQLANRGSPKNGH